MAFQIIPQSNFSSNIGAGLGQGLGQGLSEQLPKEFERARLSQGLKSLEGDLQKGNLSPFQQLTRLSEIPGMNIEKINALLPFIQQMQGVRALQQKAGVGAGQQVPGRVDQESKGVGSKEARPKGSLRQRLEMSDFAMPRDEKQIYQRAADLNRINPSLSEQEAISQAQSEDTRRVQSDQALFNRTKLIESEFDRLTNLYTQKAGNEKFRDIIGEMQGQYLDTAMNRALDQGVSPYTAAKDAAEDLLDFAKDRQQVRSNKASFVFGKGGSDVLKDLNKSRKAYQKRDQLENFRDDILVANDLSPEEADKIAFPVTQGVEKKINSLPKQRLSSRSILPKKALSDQQVDSIASKITPEDSVRSIAMNLNEKGYDGRAFLEQVKKYADSHPDALDERQQRDITTFSPRPTLGDIRLLGFNKKFGSDWR